MELKDFFARYPKVAVAFSGGVDSAYLLYAARSFGVEAMAYYVHSLFQPAFELDDAKRLCRELGQPLRILEADPLSDPRVRANPSNRCYSCKQTIFGLIRRAAAEDGFCVLLDGTNASDDADDRPGMRALAELKVLSPLRLCGITKAQVRALSRQAGLFTWDKPAYACLATRIPTGREITAEDLNRVELGETALAQLGLRDFRVRLIDGGAKLQVTLGQLPLVMEHREKILEILSPLFGAVTLDLQPRKASQ